MQMVRDDLRHFQQPWPLLRPYSHCMWFALRALDTWDRIGFVRGFKKSQAGAGRKGLPITEETITENILFDFIQASFSPGTPSTVELWQAEHEPREGNDLDLLINYPFGRVHFMVQSKLLYDTNLYPSIKHSNKQGEQIDLLLQSSRIRNAVPMYLFYNHVLGFVRTGQVCRRGYDETQFGCTVAHAQVIGSNFRQRGNWTIPTFQQLHDVGDPIAVPWIKLVCCDYQDPQALGASFIPKGDPDPVLPISPLVPKDRTLVVPVSGLDGSESMPVTYTRIESAKEMKWDLEPDPEEGRYYARFILSIDVT